MCPCKILQVDKISCIKRSGAVYSFPVTSAQGGRRALLGANIRAAERPARQLSQSDTNKHSAGRRVLLLPESVPLSIALEITLELTTLEAVERIEALEALNTGVDLQSAMQEAVAAALPAGTQLLQVSVSTPLAGPGDGVAPSPTDPAASSAPRPTSAAKVIWATSAHSPRYARGRRAPGVPLGADKAVGAPQLLMTRPGALRCASNIRIAWNPTLARPRFLDVFFNGTSSAPMSINVSRVHAVVVAVTHLGSLPAPLQSITLLLQQPGAPAAGLSTLVVYTHVAGNGRPACPALNTYALLPSLLAGPSAGARVVGIRLKPSQDKVADKRQLMQVGLDKGCLDNSYGSSSSCDAEQFVPCTR